MTDVWQATEAFYAEGVTINPGDTVADGHPILKGREQYFVPFEPMWALPPEPEEPPEEPPARKASRKAEG